MFTNFLKGKIISRLCKCPKATMPKQNVESDLEDFVIKIKSAMMRLNPNFESEAINTTSYTLTFMSDPPITLSEEIYTTGGNPASHSNSHSSSGVNRILPGLKNSPSSGISNRSNEQLSESFRNQSVEVSEVKDDLPEMCGLEESPPLESTNQNQPKLAVGQNINNGAVNLPGLKDLSPLVSSNPQHTLTDPNKIELKAPPKVQNSGFFIKFLAANSLQPTNAHFPQNSNKSNLQPSGSFLKSHNKIELKEPPNRNNSGFLYKLVTPQLNNAIVLKNPNEVLPNVQAQKSKEIAPRCRTRIVPTPPHVIYKKKSSVTKNRGMTPQNTNLLKKRKILGKENVQNPYAREMFKGLKEVVQPTVSGNPSQIFSPSNIQKDKRGTFHKIKNFDNYHVLSGSKDSKCPAKPVSFQNAHGNAKK